MEKEVRTREWLIIGGSALAGAVMLTVLTLTFWRFFNLDHNAPIDFGIMSFTIPKGALLGGGSAYIWGLFQTERQELGAKLCLAVGGLVLLIFWSGCTDGIRTSLQWDGFTALWGLSILIYGGWSYHKQWVAKAAEEQSPK